MAEDWQSLVRPVGVVPGTAITIYESKTPQPGYVLLIPWGICPGPTSSKSERGENRLAGGDRKRIVSESSQGGVVPKKNRGSVSKCKPIAGGDPKSGFILRAMSEVTEAEKIGSDESLGTQAKISKLFRLISEKKTWLEPRLEPGDPYKAPFSLGYTAWVDEDCVPWLIVEGSKLGLKFAGRDERTFEGTTTANYLISLVSFYLRNPEQFECGIKREREPGLRLSSRTLNIPGTESIGMGAGELYERYRSALMSASDPSEVHRAYHRILLHRFMRRRRLTPQARATRAADRVSDAIERRANLLQAHRLFVFNSRGCPVRINAEVLYDSGIDIVAIGSKRPILPTIQGTVDAWTKWLYEDILEIKPEKCMPTKQEIIEMRAGLRSLALGGFLG